jgi:lysophospholipid acyltransferase (LPLAT)-like uncharacterized protein
MRYRSDFSIGLTARLFVAVVKLLFCTVRLRFHEEQTGTSPYLPTISEHFLYCVWHDSTVIPAFAARHRATSALTSRHSDGTFVAKVLTGVGIRPIRGSTNRLTPSAFRELISATEEGHLVITPDGPRGPARTMSLGIVYLASRTGRSIVPTAYACTTCWRFRGSWTTLILPCPFSAVTLLAGTPIHVPPNQTRDELQHHMQAVQIEMDRLHQTLQEAKNRLTGQAKFGTL